MMTQDEQSGEQHSVVGADVEFGYMKQGHYRTFQMYFKLTVKLSDCQLVTTAE